MATDSTKTDDVDDTEETEEEEYEAPDQETWTKTTGALEKANNEAKKWRLRAQGKDPKWKPAPPAKDEDEEDEEPAKPKRRTPRLNEEQIRRDAEEAALAKAKPGLVRAAARDALRDAGLIVSGKGTASFDRAFRLIDLEEVDVDEDGTVSGVEDQIKQVKRDYPELFAKKGARAVDAGAGSNGDGAGKKTTTSADRVAALILGKS